MPILLIASCTKENSSAIILSPQLVDGRITFENQQDLLDFMNESRTNADISRKLPSSFVSYAELVDMAFDDMEKVSSESELELLKSSLLYVDKTKDEIRPIVPDGPFAGLLNQDLEIGIGDKVIRFTPTNAIEFQLVENNNLVYNGTIETNYEILATTDDVELGQLSSRASSCVTNLNSETRMKGELQKNNFGVYGEFRFVTKTQKKKFGIWNRSRSSYLFVGGTARGFRCIFQEWESLGYYENSANNASSVDFAIGVTLSQYCGDDGTGNHRAIRDGFTLNCTTSR